MEEGRAWRKKLHESMVLRVDWIKDREKYLSVLVDDFVEDLLGDAEGDFSVADLVALAANYRRRFTVHVRVLPAVGRRAHGQKHGHHHHQSLPH